MRGVYDALAFRRFLGRRLNPYNSERIKLNPQGALRDEVPDLPLASVSAASLCSVLSGENGIDQREMSGQGLGDPPRLHPCPHPRGKLSRMDPEEGAPVPVGSKLHKILDRDRLM
jgi:hypothetical protein